VWKKNTTSNFTQAKNMPLIEHEDIAVFSEAKVGNGAKIKMNYFPQKVKGKSRKWKNNQSSPSNPKAKNLIGRNSIDVVSDSFYPKTILEFPKDSLHLHPTQKPLALCEYLVKTYTNSGDLILDFCAGSGTTGLAAKNLNRQFILIEKEKEYYDICVERLK
jgi:site-specific DNA-methyltransferase (adenine-specific)